MLEFMFFDGRALVYVSDAHCEWRERVASFRTLHRSLHDSSGPQRCAKNMIFQYSSAASPSHFGRYKSEFQTRQRGDLWKSADSCMFRKRFGSLEEGDWSNSGSATISAMNSGGVAFLVLTDDFFVPVPYGKLVQTGWGGWPKKHSKSYVFVHRNCALACCDFATGA